MENVYMFRHQAGGYVPEFVFAEPPTAQQLAAVSAFCAQRYGTAHPKSGETYWMRVVEVPLRDANDMPMPEETGARAESSAALGRVSASGVAHVENAGTR